MKSARAAKMLYFPDGIPVWHGAPMRESASLDPLAPAADRGGLPPCLAVPRTTSTAWLVNCYGPLKSLPLNVTYPGFKVKTGRGTCLWHSPRWGLTGEGQPFWEAQLDTRSGVNFFLNALVPQGIVMSNNYFCSWGRKQRQA